MSYIESQVASAIQRERLAEAEQVRQAHRVSVVRRARRRAERLTHKAERIARRAERATSQARVALARSL